MPRLEFDFSIADRRGDPILIAGAGSDDREVAMGPHAHSRGQLISSARGLLSVGIDSGLWIVPASHSVWLPPHHRHAVRSHGPFEGWGVFVDEAACATLPAAPCVIRTSGLLREAVLRAAEWRFGPEDARSARVAAVLLDEIGSLPVEPFALPMPRDPRLQRIAHELIDAPAEAGDLETFARAAAMSPRTLRRRFVAETGFNFTEWRQRARLLRSLEMLAGDQAVTTIALDLGYATASAFIATFRRVFGETPASYRRRL